MFWFVCGAFFFQVSVHFRCVVEVARASCLRSVIFKLFSVFFSGFKSGASHLRPLTWEPGESASSCLGFVNWSSDARLPDPMVLRPNVHPVKTYGRRLNLHTNWPPISLQMESSSICPLLIICTCAADKAHIDSWTSSAQWAGYCYSALWRQIVTLLLVVAVREHADVRMIA